MANLLQLQSTGPISKKIIPPTVRGHHYYIPTVLTTTLQTFLKTHSDFVPQPRQSSNQHPARKSPIGEDPTGSSRGTQPLRPKSLPVPFFTTGTKQLAQSAIQAERAGVEWSRTAFQKSAAWPRRRRLAVTWKRGGGELLQEGACRILSAMA